MLNSFVTEERIREKLSQFKEKYPSLTELLLKRVELTISQRFKKTIRQSIRKIRSIGIKGFLRNISPRGVIRTLNRPSDKKKVLFLAGLPTFNIVEISMYLRKTGEFETILLTESPWLSSFFQENFNKVYVYNSYYEVAHILLSSKPDIIHALGSARYYFLGALAKCFNNAGIISAFIDPPSFEPGADNPEELSKKPEDTQLDCFSEEFLFKQADGIIMTMNRYFAGDILRQRYHSKIPLLEFPTYACNEFFKEEEKYSKKDGNIYLVYGGVIGPSDKPKEIFGATQFIDIARSLIHQGFCFHMYLSPYFSPIQTKKLYADYVQLAETSPGFGFKHGFQLDKAIEEFSRYDYASMIHDTKGLIMNKFHFETCISSKFFTYISAGLPIIVVKDIGYIASLVREYEIGIVIDQDEIGSLAEIMKGYDYKKLQENVKKAREDFTMEKHINRLIEFYGQVSGNRKTTKSREVAYY